MLEVPFQAILSQGLINAAANMVQNIEIDVKCDYELVLKCLHVINLGNI